MKLNTFNNDKVDRWKMLGHFLIAFTVGTLLLAAVEVAVLKRAHDAIRHSIEKHITEQITHSLPQS